MNSLNKISDRTQRNFTQFNKSHVLALLSLSRPYQNIFIGPDATPLLALSSVSLALCPYKNQLNYFYTREKRNNNRGRLFLMQILRKKYKALFRYIIS